MSNSCEVEKKSTRNTLTSLDNGPPKTPQYEKSKENKLRRKFLKAIPSLFDLRQYIGVLVCGLTLWGTSWFVFKEAVLPGGFLFNMSGVVIAGYIFGHTLERYTTINPVVGMTLIGALYRNFGPTNFLQNPVADVIDFHLRRVYPVIILTKGPLGWNWEYIKHNSVKVFSLATLPWVVECLSTAFFAHILLDYPWYWGLHLGSITASVSPAVVAPTALALNARGFGVKNQIGLLVANAGGLDTAFTEGMCGVINSAIFYPASLPYRIVKGVFAILVGIVLGIIWGVLCDYIPDHSDIYAPTIRSLLIFTGGFLLTYAGGFAGWGGVSGVAIMVCAGTAATMWSRLDWPINNNPVSEVYKVLWLIFEPMLFTLSGYYLEADLDPIPLSPASNVSDEVIISSLPDTFCYQPEATTPLSVCDLDDGSKRINVASSEPRQSSPISTTPLNVRDDSTQNTLTDWVEEEWQFIQEIGPLEDKKPLKQLLEVTTFGRSLLEKQAEHLTTKERKILVQLIVEHQLRILPSVSDTIRQEVWSSWAKEICSLFKGEHPDIYYIPYRATERQALPASGLLHNRLITHRRFLKPKCHKRSSSGNTSPSSEKSTEKRVRPLPRHSINDPDDEDSINNDIEWLEGSSSPFDLVLKKWQATHKAREKNLKEKSIDEYLQQFPALRLPAGHELLVSDFEKNYPRASASFDENFPLIKRRLLEMLINKSTQIRPESAVCDLLDLATAGEEQGSVAALRCIPYLVKQVPPVQTKARGKKWKPSRIELSQAFISYVTSPGDIERCIDDRITRAQDKGISLGPYIIAVGASWSNIVQYEVVVTKSVRYQFSDIKTALTTAFKIYFALDFEYAGDAALCWMFVQRAIYKIVTKFDAVYHKSVTLRELIQDCERTSSL